MSYLRFDKTLMTNLEESLPKEILRSNRSGAYSCSTIVDCNTRKYHGLLVVPVPELDDENHVLLSSLDATVIQHGAEFNLGLHKYGGGNFSPRGHKYIREFSTQQVPTTIYRVGDVILRREMMFQHFENRIIIRYTLVDSHCPTTMRLQPFLAFRSVREYTYENDRASRDFQEVQNGIKTCMYPGYPELFMQLNKENEFVYKPDWYRGLEYPKEQERGYAGNEDLYVPGYFVFTLDKGESVVFSAGLNEIDTSTLADLAEYEKNVRTPRDNFYNTLVNSAHQFFVHREHEDYVLAGYPWFKCRARDMFISLPGLTLTNNELKKYDDVMETAEKAIRHFMAGEPLEVSVTEMEHPDVLLWAVWCLQQYADTQGAEKCMQKLMSCRDNYQPGPVEHTWLAIIKHSKGDIKGATEEVRSAWAQVRDAMDKVYITRAVYEMCKAEGRYDHAVIYADTLLAYQTEATNEDFRQAVVTVQRDYYDRQAQKEGTAKERMQRLTIIVIIVCMIVIMMTAIAHRFRVHVKDSLIESKMNEILLLSERLKKDDKENQDLKMQAEKSMRGRWDLVNMLCNEYFEKGDNEKLKAGIISKVDKEMERICSRKHMEEIETLVNNSMNGIVTKLRTQCPELKQEDVLFATLVYAGLAPRAVCTWYSS